MAVMLDILTGVLSGSAFGSKVQYLEDYASKEPLGTAHVMIAIDIEKIMPIDFFKEKIDMLIEEIKGCPKAANVDEIYVPGEIENNILQIRSKEGIPLTRTVLRDLNELGNMVGLDSLPE